MGSYTEHALRFPMTSLIPLKRELSMSPEYISSAHVLPRKPDLVDKPEQRDVRERLPMHGTPSKWVNSFNNRNPLYGRGLGAGSGTLISSFEDQVPCSAPQATLPHRTPNAKSQSPVLILRSIPPQRHLRAVTLRPVLFRAWLTVI